MPKNARLAFPLPFALTAESLVSPVAVVSEVGKAGQSVGQTAEVFKAAQATQSASKTAGVVAQASSTSKAAKAVNLFQKFSVYGAAYGVINPFIRSHNTVFGNGNKRIGFGPHPGHIMPR